MSNPDLLERAIKYARLWRIAIDLKSPLGSGQDGSVWKSNRQTAVKVLERERNYRIERECYQRFQNRQIIKLHGFSVPQLVAFDDELCIIEMGIVTPPFILDFAKAWLDRPADYTPETMEDWNQNGVEIFGQERSGQVKALLWSLQQLGIFYYDAKPQNIMFGDEKAL